MNSTVKPLSDSPELGGPNLTAKYTLIQCVVSLAYCCVLYFATVFLLARGFSNSAVGLTLTSASGLALVTQPLLATFADQTRQLTLRQITAGLMVICCVAALLLIITPSLILPTAILYIVLLWAFNSQQSLVVALALEHINAGAPVNFSLARGFGSFAFSLLALALGYLTRSYGSEIIMPLGLVFSLVGVLLVLSFPKVIAPVAHNSAVSSGQASNFSEFARHHLRFMALLGSVTLLFFSHTLINTYSIQVVQHVGGSTAEMGIAAAVGSFIELPAMALFPLLMHRVKKVSTILKWSGVFFVLKALLTWLAPTIGWFYAAQSLQFFAFAMFTPAAVFYVNQVIPGVDKVKGQAGLAMALGISSMIGNSLGGLLLDTNGGVSLMLTVGLGVSLVGLVLVWLLAE